MTIVDAFIKLGIAEGAKPEEFAAALLKFCTTEGSAADKLIVLAALAPTAFRASKPLTIDNSDGGRRAVYSSWRRNGINGAR